MANRKKKSDSDTPPQPTLSGASRLLGIHLLSVTKKRVTGEMRVSPDHINRNGRVQGGTIMALGDMMGAAGTIANLPPGCRTATLESKTNFFAAGSAPIVTAVSTPLHIGKSTMVWQTTIRNVDKRVVAIVTQTQIVIYPEFAALHAKANEPRKAVTWRKQSRNS